MRTLHLSLGDLHRGVAKNGPKSRDVASPRKHSVDAASHQPRTDGFWHAVADVKTPWSREGPFPTRLISAIRLLGPGQFDAEKQTTCADRRNLQSAGSSLRACASSNPSHFMTGKDGYLGNRLSV